METSDCRIPGCCDASVTARLIVEVNSKDEMGKPVNTATPQIDKQAVLTDKVAGMNAEQRSNRLNEIEFKDENADEIIKLVFGADAVLAD